MRELARQITDVARGRGVEFADVRLRRSAGTAMFVQDGRVQRASSGTSSGAGVRVLAEGAWGFACVDSLDAAEIRRALDEATAAAREIARGASRRVELARPGVIDRQTGEIGFRPRAASLEEKARKLLALEKAGMGAVRPGAIVNSALSYADGETAEVVANTYGTVVAQRFARSMCACTMVARDGDSSESWTERIGTPAGTGILDGLDPDGFTARAAREAYEQTHAAPPPGGRMQVIFDPSMTGLFVHECLGHSAEADLVLRGHSTLGPLMGQTVASELVTVVDDPTLPDAWGGYAYDSEGVPAERVTLIEAGRLTCWIESMETAARTGRAPNGHGRAEGTLARPIPRMSNTFLAPGGHEVDEMVRGIERGIMLSHGASGYAMVERGQFSCQADRGWRIEHGTLGEPVRHIAVSGDIIETLKSIDRVSAGLTLCDPGYCGKDGQEVPVDNGGPHVRVSGALVGGAM